MRNPGLRKLPSFEGDFWRTCPIFALRIKYCYPGQQTNLPSVSYPKERHQFYLPRLFAIQTSLKRQSITNVRDLWILILHITCVSMYIYTYICALFTFTKVDFYMHLIDFYIFLTCFFDGYLSLLTKKNGIKRKITKKNVITASIANFLYCCIQCWLSLTQEKVCAIHEPIHQKECKNLLLEHFQNVFYIPQRQLCYIASSHFPKLSFMAVDLKLEIYIELEVN